MISEILWTDRNQTLITFFILISNLRSAVFKDRTQSLFDEVYQIYRERCVSHWCFASRRYEFIFSESATAGEKTAHHPSLLSHPAIFQLHAHQPWHWWNVPAQLPHKNPHLQSLAPISPLAKLPTRAVDLQMRFLQSPAQHETPQTEEAAHSCISKGPRGKITARTKTWLGRQKEKKKDKKKATLMEFTLSATL